MQDIHISGKKAMNSINLLKTICQNTDVENLADEIRHLLSESYDISEINILYYDSESKKLKNVIKDFEPAQDYYSVEKMDTISNVFEKLLTSDFVLNDDPNLPVTVEEIGNTIVKSISFPLNYEDKTIGLFRLKFRNKAPLTEKAIKRFEIFNCALSIKVINIVLSKKIHVNEAFYRSMKDIARIIDTQYDFQYIIPLIGEMIDKFVPNHLIYIFIKKDDKYVLYWPTACWNNKVYELIENVTPQDEAKIADDHKTGVFPLLSENVIIGCIVAHSTIDKLTDEEIGYLSELTKQSAITIERANTYSELLQNATMDALTGLNNRRQFEVRLSEQYASANRQNTPLCAIMIDIDFFKKFNDTYGHAVGDTVLKTVANVIKENLREYDIPSRYGGEEFCILLPQTSLEEAKVVAERLRSAVEKETVTIDTVSKPLQVTISVGLAELDIKDLAEDLYMKADSALYQAKETGKNKVVIYTKVKG